MLVLCLSFANFFFVPLLSVFSQSHSSPSFHSLPKLRLMHLTNHWARKGINSYSKQRAIMGTLVLRKLRILKPARRYAGITECFCTLFSKQERQGTRQKRKGRSMFPSYKGRSRPLILKRLNRQMTWWSSLQWQGDNEAVHHSFKHTMGLEQCTQFWFFFFLHDHIQTHTYTNCMCVQACLLMLVVIFSLHSKYKHLPTLMRIICINLRMFWLFHVILCNHSWQMTTKRLQCLLISKYMCVCVLRTAWPSVHSPLLFFKCHRHLKWKGFTFFSHL